MPQRKVAQKTSTQIVTVTKKQTPQPKRKKSKPSKKVQKVRSLGQPLQDSFVFGLTRPDLTGPIRVPREGGSSRTILGMDKSIIQMGNTAVYTAIILKTEYFDTSYVATYYTAGSATAAWTSAAGLQLGMQFPPAATFYDINLVAENAIADYIGAPLNCTGEILLGTVPRGTDLTGTTFNTLGFYPGFVRMPLKDLLTEGSKSVFGKKMSPVSNEFVSTGQPCEDYEVPVIALSLTASNACVSILVNRTFEGRSAVNTGGVPYEKTGSSYTADLNKYQDVLSDLSEMTHPITDGFSEYVREMALGAIGSYSSTLITPALTLGSHGLMNAISNYQMNRVRLLP